MYKKFIAVLSALLLVIGLSASASAAMPETLIPSGAPFGIKMYIKGAVVIGMTGVDTEKGVVSPAKDGGIKKGDIIKTAAGSDFDSAESLISIIESSGGKPIPVVVERSGVEQTLKITPAFDRASQTYRIGVFVRDSAAGIGTVTYIVPGDNSFGGLGHGIYDVSTSSLLPLGKATATDVNITDVLKSIKDSPGELHGTLGKTKIGNIFANTDEGVFGKLNIVSGDTAPLPVAKREELKTGKAYILSTLSGSKPEKFDIEIEKIYSSSDTTKNFLIRVTDKKLLEKAGGIVRGMSGSPIIMDGKIIGAVTHVLVSDPTHGYGICIENMLNSAAVSAEQNTLSEYNFEYPADLAA